MLTEDRNIMKQGVEAVYLDPGQLKGEFSEQPFDTKNQIGHPHVHPVPGDISRDSLVVCPWRLEPGWREVADPAFRSLVEATIAWLLVKRKRLDERSFTSTSAEPTAPYETCLSATTVFQPPDDVTTPICRSGTCHVTQKDQYEAASTKQEYTVIQLGANTGIRKACIVYTCSKHSKS
ncbi:hypothetical protein Bbelb_142660 [Branchiostoma belcheri]|nr:hypothetical protein Bbelb_142660 [Branchiostoma belcheri]